MLLDRAPRGFSLSRNHLQALRGTTRQSIDPAREKKLASSSLGPHMQFDLELLHVRMEIVF